MLHTKFIDSITDISATKWHQVFSSDYPFTRHQFIAALEQSGCTTTKTGWQAKHLLIYHGDELIAAMPGYIKRHSYGEYIFDWAWADAYHQYGYEFYPKIVFAIPFTPATGPRLSVKESAFREGPDKLAIYQAIETALDELTKSHKLSSWQILFPQKALSDELKQQGWMQRNNVQFHWRNGTQGKNYKDFDDFLNNFTSRKRKVIKKERQKVKESGINIRQIKGEQISDAMWQQFYIFYQATYIKRSGHGGYLNGDFFKQIGKIMPENLMMVIADDNEHIVAAALYFYDNTTLYGRYWGCLEHFDMLHFECCYYQGIEFCIQNGLQLFDAGAQGEHKLARGFEPIQTFGNYRILNSQFNQAIENYIEQEWQHNLDYLEAAREKLPFKNKS